MLHVTWTEWKNMFSLEIYCRTAKLQVDGLVRSYGAADAADLPDDARSSARPSSRSRTYAAEDVSWAAEWEHFARRDRGGGPLLGDLDDARYAWQRVEDAYASSPAYAEASGRALGRSP